MNLFFEETTHNAVNNITHPIPNPIDIDWSNIDPIFVEVSSSSTCNSIHHHQNDAHDQLSEMVRHQLCTQQYAKINLEQQSAASQQSHHLISCVISSCLRDDLDASHMVPDDIVNLLCAFYPIFYWNPHYISLRSRSHLFIVHKECCKLSEMLCSSIQDPDTFAQTCSSESTSGSHLRITKGIASDSLELFIKYLVNMHGREVRSECEDIFRTQSGDLGAMLHMIPCRWDEEFIDSLSCKRLFDLHATAKKMKCKSLVELARNRLVIFTGNSPQEIDEGRAANAHYERTHCSAAQEMRQMLDSHFKSLRFNFNIAVTNT